MRANGEPASFSNWGYEYRDHGILAPGERIAGAVPRGFRPGRKAHEAIEAVREHAMQMRGGWVLEADIEAFFDSVDHAKLREILSQRVRDGVLLRLIGKWLNAGVMENGCVYHPRRERHTAV